MRMGPSAIPTGALRSRVTSVLAQPRRRPRSRSRGVRMAAASLSRLETAMGTPDHIRRMAVPRTRRAQALLGAKSPQRVVHQWLRCPTRHYTQLTVSAGTTVAGRDCLPLGRGAFAPRTVRLASGCHASSRCCGIPSLSRAWYPTSGLRGSDALGILHSDLNSEASDT